MNAKDKLSNPEDKVIPVHKQHFLEDWETLLVRLWCEKIASKISGVLMS
jgi:hypothetical protein